MVNSLTAGIPQSDANPILGFFDQSDELAAKHARDMDNWRRENTDKLDRALLDPEGFYKDHPIPNFHPDPAAARDSVTLASYLALQNDGRPVTGALYPELFRDRIARERFGGRGEGSDQAFLAEIRQEATGRKEARVFFQDLARSAAESALMSAAGETGAEYPAWMTEARQRPGYRKDLEPAYLLEWRQRQRELGTMLAPVRDLVATQWQAMKEGKTADLGGLDGYLVNEESRETLLFAISGLVKALPKEQQPSVLANFRKQFLRRDLPANLGGLQRSMKPMDRDEPLPEDYLDQLEPGYDLEKFNKVKRAEFEKDTRSRDRFLRKLESIVNDEYDPIVPLSKKGSNWEALEKGLYAAPGVGLTLGINVLPGAGQAAMYEVLRKDSADQARGALVQGGMDEDAADLVAADIGTYAALIQLPMESLGTVALAGKLPFVSKAINRFTTGIATRYLARAGSSAAVETSTELLQNLVPPFLQEIAAAASQDIPDTQWTGPGGVFQDYDKQTLEVVGAILPLSLIMAGGGVFADRRIQTIAATDDLTLRAAGVSEEGIAALRAATGIGQQESAIAAWGRRDMNSPTATAAQEELTARIRAGQDTAAAASDSGILPRAVRHTDGSWTLYDTATGGEIGQAADWQGAAQLATAHANYSGETDTDRVALVFSTYQAAEVSGQWGTDTNRPTEFNLDLGRTVTAAEAAAESDSARQRVAAQERLMGGDGGVTNVVLGQSRTELAQGQLRTVNRILDGGSVLDVFHEETHGFRRQAHARGILTREDDVNFVNAVNQVLQGQTTREGQPLQLLPADFDTLTPADQETALDEAISAIAEAEIVRTRKGSTNNQAPSTRNLPSGLVSNNLSALARLLGDQTLGKFRSFINAIREYFGLAIDRAAQIKRGLADGTLDAATYEGYLAKLLGLDEQIDYDQQARDAEAAILDGAELAPLSGDPFSIGQRRIQTAEELDAELFGKIGEEALRLEQPRAKYEDKRQLLLDFSTSIVGDRQGDKPGPDAGRRVGRLQVLQERFAADLAINLKVGFIGETIESTYDLVSKAQALRNPQFETFYLLAQDDKGTLLDVMAITSRVPCCAQIFEAGQTMDEGMESHAAFLAKAGATSYRLLHNHPSGDPTPSQADIRVTWKHSDEMFKRGFRMVEHVVINHGTFSTIDEFGQSPPIQTLPDIANSADPYHLIPKAFGVNQLQVLDSPEHVATLGQQLELQKKHGEKLLTYFLVDARFRVSGTMMGTLVDLKTLDTTTLQDFARENAAAQIMAYGEAATYQDAENLIDQLSRMNQAGLVMEAVIAYPGGNYISGIESGRFRGSAGGGRFFGGEYAVGERVQEGQPVAPSFSLGSRRITPAQDAAYLAAVEAGDMETAQRMVDEAAKAAGYTEAASHVTDRAFDAFKRAKFFGDGTDRIGFFFTKSEQLLKERGEQLLKNIQRGSGGTGIRLLNVYLNLQNPQVLPDRQALNRWIAEADVKLDDSNFVDRGESRPAGKDPTFAESVAAFEKDPDFGMTFSAADLRSYATEPSIRAKVHDYLVSPTGRNAFFQEASELAEKAGQQSPYDGLIIENDQNAGQAMVVFDPNQVKSADPVTRDESGNVIPLSQRFNSADDRISFSIGPIRFTPGGGSKQVTIHDTTIDFGISRDGTTGEIILIKTPRAKRGQGSARAALGEFITQADKHRLTLFLTPEPMDKGVTKTGLVDLYKSLGFVPNSGRNKDFRSRGTMVRPPVIADDRLSFSLGSRRLSVLAQDSIRRIQNPLRRAQAMERLSRKLEDLRLEAERLELLSGTKRLKRALTREAAVRQALRREELENEAWARHSAILSDDDLVKIKAQPGHAYLSDPSSPLKGRLESRTAAAKRHPDLFQIHQNPAEYEGSENVSRTLFGGTLTPDQAARDMFEAGLLREATPEALWQLLESEARHVANMKRVLESAKADLREARQVAKAETNAWLATQADTQATVYSPRQEILRALSTLDAILSVVPAEIRGKVGGWVQAARISDPDAGLEFLRERLAKVDRELEKWLKGQYNTEFLALLDRARPERDEAGKRPRGKIGADVHALFADLREAMTLTAAETEAEATRLEVLAEQEDLTPEQQSHAMLQASLVRLVGDWSKASAARREAAVIETTRIFEGGYMEERIRLSRQREDRNKKRANLAAATGSAGTREQRRARAVRDDGTVPGRIAKAALSLLSFEQIVQRAFGEGTPDAEALVDWERRAAHAKADAIQHKVDQLDDLFASLAGGKLKGERLRYQMADPAQSITATDARGREHSFSQLEAITATLMWRQEDGRRHMEGHVDDQGAPAGEWNYTQEFVDQLEDQLTPAAKAIRLHLATEYGAEYERLNSVFRQLYGVSLPRHAHYSPLTVKPAQAAGGQTLDPVTGSTMTGSGLTPGSLKTRSQTAIAEPDFRDALQTYIGHAKQMEHWIAYAPFATEAMALLNARTVGNSIEAAGGKEVLQTLRGWLDLFAQGGTRDASAHLAGNQLVNRMVGRAAAVALVGRVSVLAIQSTQLGAALAEMPATAYLSRLARLFAGRLDWSAAIRSDYIQRRKNLMPPVVQQAMEGLASSKPNRLKYLARKMGETISGADALFTAGTYAITYDYHLGQAREMGIADPHAYARQAAERSTDRVAQPVRPGTRSLYEVTGTNPAVRVLWSFASESRQKLVLAGYALGSTKSAGAKARALAVTWFAGGVVASVIRATMRDIRDDDDDEIFDADNWDPKRLALASLTGPFGGIPFLGDALESSVYKAFGEYMPEGNLFSSIPKAVTRSTDLLGGDRPEDLEEAMKDAETILSGAGLFTESGAAAASVSHLLRDAVNLWQNATGD
jgi:hypothetical protein